MKLEVCFVLSLALSLLFVSDARQFSRCELVRQLRSHRFPANKLRQWVCLIESHSGGRTNLVSRVNKSGHREYGLFQLSDRFWCSDSDLPGKDCNVTCADLLTDDITKAAKCAKKVYKRHGFTAWNGWSKCQGSLPDISSC
ncbi:PREDICTED: lysozyme-like [Papilio polytes]|uniref:lysozyme-like n=1 Tax=Papilio polytes TaxID=76194 RepID=UPI000676A6DC|nr:PREDICTED: lysozyme-like [Papilio polytes]